MLAATAAPALPPRAAAALTGLALPSLVVIVLHPLVLYFLPPETTSFPLPALVAVAFAAPLALGLLIVRTPLAPWLAGVDQIGARPERPAV